jgi:hypothetical protein
MVGPRQDQDHRGLDRGYRPAECGRFRRGIARDGAQFERAHRDRPGARRCRGTVRPSAGAGGAAGDRHFGRWDGRFRPGPGRGARPDRGGGDHDQRARDPDRGALARRLLSPQRDRRPGRLCPRRPGFQQLRRGDAQKTGAGGCRRRGRFARHPRTEGGEAPLTPSPLPTGGEREKRLRCNRCGSARSR